MASRIGVKADSHTPTQFSVFTECSGIFSRHLTVRLNDGFDAERIEQTKSADSKTARQRHELSRKNFRMCRAIMINWKKTFYTEIAPVNQYFIQ